MTLFSRKEKKSDVPTQKTTKSAFGKIVESLPRPSSRAGKPRSSSRAAAPNGLTRLFQGDEFSNSGSGFSPASKSSRTSESDEDVVIWHEGPQRSVPVHTHQATKIKGHKAYESQDFVQSPPVPPKSGHAPIKKHLYPRSTEHLYVDCGIVACEEVNGMFPGDFNETLELWAFDNPVAAMHIMALAKKWGLHPCFAETMILTDSSLWKKTAPAHRENELQKSFAQADEFVDERLATVGRHRSKHLVQKQGTHQRVKDLAYDVTRQEIFASSDLTPPTGKGKAKVAIELPYAVTALYCEVAGVELGALSEEGKERMMSDWSRRLPVSDYHLKRVIEKWSPDVKRINIDPVGYQSLKAELGSPAVERRARGLSNVSVSGREGRSVPTQGQQYDSKSFRMRVMNA